MPDILAGGRTEYRFPLPFGMQGLVSADARYVGRSKLTFIPFIQAPMGGYVLAQLSAQVSYRRWRLAAFLVEPDQRVRQHLLLRQPVQLSAGSGSHAAAAAQPPHSTFG